MPQKPPYSTSSIAASDRGGRTIKGSAENNRPDGPLAPEDAAGNNAPLPEQGRQAVALSYEIGGQELPKIVATGHGHVAEEIIRLAFEAGVKVRQDADLAQLLVKFDLDSEIPTEAIETVAELLAYVYKANGRMAEMRAAAAAERTAAVQAGPEETTDGPDRPLAARHPRPSAAPTPEQPSPAAKPDDGV